MLILEELLVNHQSLQTHN